MYEEDSCFSKASVCSGVGMIFMLVYRDAQKHILSNNEAGKQESTLKAEYEPTEP